MGDINGYGGKYRACLEGASLQVLQGAENSQEANEYNERYLAALRGLGDIPPSPVKCALKITVSER